MAVKLFWPIAGQSIQPHHTREVQGAECLLQCQSFLHCFAVLVCQRFLRMCFGLVLHTSPVHDEVCHSIVSIMNMRLYDHPSVTISQIPWTQACIDPSASSTSLKPACLRSEAAMIALFPLPQKVVIGRAEGIWSNC